MITIGKNCKIGNLKLASNYEEIIIGNNVSIGDNVQIDVKKLKIGDRSIIGEGFTIEGRNIILGTEFYSAKNCTIGGGSCQDLNSSLKIGDLCHLGEYVFINTARAVTIGNEVGLGQHTRLYTHGAYLSFLEGFPVEFGPITIGNNVWIPNAQIFPNVTIGNNSVIGAGSVVNKDITAGSLAAGVPVKILKENYYPVKLADKIIDDKIDKFITHFIVNIIGDIMGPKRIIFDGSNRRRVYVDKCMTLFDFESKRIDGQATDFCEKFKNEARRWGYRFKYYKNEEGMYKEW
jgi:acetyltransferase-like isoleucine patch superfamily enzyme